ncbi:MAG: aldo/keto reductase [Thermoleophilia bacterium]|nr:aldo/keto reductase [Thermoleophilia bacterium]
MRERPFGRAGFGVSELGVGMWGLADWSGGDASESFDALHVAVEAGCTFFDTALAYGRGESERILGRLLAETHGRALFTATKVPPKNKRWPSENGADVDEVFPAAHIRECALRSQENLQIETIDLLQFHVWQDAWADDARWQEAVAALRDERVIRHVGVSVNRLEPANVLRTLETGLISAVQVVYNVFEQAPEDDLFPACRELGVAVIARVPLDEGSLGGTLTKDTRWPEGDWRNLYFKEENLTETVDRVEALRPLVSSGSTMAELALRFVLSHPDVTTVIPGMRRIRHVQENAAAAAAGPLDPALVDALRAHRWNRVTDSKPW